MRPAKLLEFPSIWVLVVSVLSAAATALAVSEQAWAYFSWTEQIAVYFNGVRRLLEPLMLEGCDAGTTRAIAAAGLVTFGVTAVSIVLAIIAMLDFATPDYHPRKPASPTFFSLIFAKGTVCVVFAGVIGWYLWFYDGSLPMRAVDCARLRGAGYFIGKAVLLSAIVQYLLFTGLRDLIRVTKRMGAS
jgi:hypothetical protein